MSFGIQVQVDKIVFIYCLEYRYVVLSRGMKNWLDTYTIKRSSEIMIDYLVRSNLGRVL
jgi:hypothetical protein